MHKNRILHFAFACLLATTVALPLHADMPEIQNATAHRVGMGWRIDVTLKHPDTGWEHYADGWDVHDTNGKKIGFRELMHPHVDEQPFTRALVNVMVPDGTREIFVRARCSKAGWSSESVKVTLKN